jgi:hypothetical protein
MFTSSKSIATSGKQEHRTRIKNKKPVAKIRSPPSELSTKLSNKALRRNFYVNELPLLQATNPYKGSDQLNPVNEEENEGSYDLVAPYEGDAAPLHTPRTPGRHDVLV